MFSEILCRAQTSMRGSTAPDYVTLSCSRGWSCSPPTPPSAPSEHVHSYPAPLALKMSEQIYSNYSICAEVAMWPGYGN